MHSAFVIIFQFFTRVHKVLTSVFSIIPQMEGSPSDKIIQFLKFCMKWGFIVTWPPIALHVLTLPLPFRVGNSASRVLIEKRAYFWALEYAKNIFIYLLLPRVSELHHLVVKHIVKLELLCPSPFFD